MKFFVFISVFLACFTHEAKAYHFSEAVEKITHLANHPDEISSGTITLLVTDILQYQGPVASEDMIHLIAGLGKLKRVEKAPFTWLSPAFNEFLEKNTLTLLNQLGPPDLSRLIHNLYTLEVKLSPEWVKAWEKASLNKISDFEAIPISSSLYSFSKLQIKLSHEVLQAMQKQAIVKLNDFNSWSLASIIHSFSLIKIAPNREFELAWQDRAFSLMASFTPEQLVASIQAFAHLGLSPAQDFIQAWKKQVYSQIEKFDLRSLANIAYSILIMPRPNELQALLKTLVEKLVSLRNADSNLERIETQHQFFLIAQYYSLFENQNLPIDKKALLESLKENSFTDSALERAFGNFLQSKFKGLEHSFWCDEIASPLDYAIPSKKIAIQIDGPWHFISTSDGRRVQLPKDLFQNQMLEKAGWKVIRIPAHFADNQLGRYIIREAELTEYLQKEMSELPSQTQSSPKIEKKPENFWAARIKAQPNLVKADPKTSEAAAEPKKPAPPTNIWEARKLKNLLEKTRLRPDAPVFVPRGHTPSKP